MSTTHSPVLARRFADAVGRFSVWAASIPEDRRHGEWECDYPDWPEITSSWTSLVADRPVMQWERSLVETALYAIARDNESELLVDQVPEASLRFLATEASVCSEPDAKWQFAAALGKTRGNEDVLLTFADDANEYVRRRAVQSLARIGSAFAPSLALREWKLAADDFPWSRMNALWVLHHVSDPLLETFLAQGRTSPNELLRDYAEKVAQIDP